MMDLTRAFKIQFPSEEACKGCFCVSSLLHDVSEAHSPTAAGWRGATGMGVSVESDLPVHWGVGTENIRWATKVEGSGNSSPIRSERAGGRDLGSPGKAAVLSKGSSATR